MDFEPEVNWTQRRFYQLFQACLILLVWHRCHSWRIILKGIWQTRGQQWDSFIEDHLNSQFGLDLRTQLKKLLKCKMVSNVKRKVRNELHVFGDASKMRFAVAYVVTEDSNQCRKLPSLWKGTCSSRKHHTIPKLELMAAITGN